MRQLTAIICFLAFLGLFQTGFGLFGTIMLADFEDTMQISQSVFWQYILLNGAMNLLILSGLLWARHRIKSIAT